MWVRIFSTLAPAPRIFGDAGENDRLTVGKLSYERQVSAHGLDGLSKRGEQQIAALFKARNAVLRDPESFGHPDLRELARLPQLAQGHLLGDQLSSARLDLL